MRGGWWRVGIFAGAPPRVPTATRTFVGRTTKKTTLTGTINSGYSTVESCGSQQQHPITGKVRTHQHHQQQQPRQQKRSPTLTPRSHSLRLTYVKDGCEASASARTLPPSSPRVLSARSKCSRRPADAAGHFSSACQVVKLFRGMKGGDEVLKSRAGVEWSIRMEQLLRIFFVMTRVWLQLSSSDMCNTNSAR